SPNNLDLTHTAMKRGSEASHLLLEWEQAKWANLTQNFPNMSAQQKQMFLTRTGFEGGPLLSLIFQGNDVEARVGVRAALLTKQLLFEAARQESAALRAVYAASPPDWRASWQERGRLRGQVATSCMLGAVAASRA